MLQTNFGDKPNEEYYKAELSQVIERIYALEATRLQLATFFGTANLTALGFGFNEKHVGLILIAVAIFAVFLFLDTRARKQQLVFYFRGLQLQKYFAPFDPETFLQLTPSAHATESARILALSDVNDRKAAIRKSKMHYRGSFFFLPLIVLIGELCTAIFLRYFYQWSFF